MSSALVSTVAAVNARKKIHIRAGGSSLEDDILEVLPVLLRYSLLSITGRYTVSWQTSLDQ